MATPHACAALVDVLPDVLRLRRDLGVPAAARDTAALAAVLELGAPGVSELAEHLRLDLSTVSRQVTGLRARRLLVATPNPADGRSLRLQVTPEGVERLRQTRRMLVDELVHRLDAWDDRDVGTLTDLLGRLARTGDAAPAEHPHPPAGPDVPTDARPDGTPDPHLQEIA